MSKRMNDDGKVVDCRVFVCDRCYLGCRMNIDSTNLKYALPSQCPFEMKTDDGTESDRSYWSVKI